MIQIQGISGRAKQHQRVHLQWDVHHMSSVYLSRESMQQRLLAPSSSDVLRIDIRALLWVFFLSFSSRLIDRL